MIIHKVSIDFISNGNPNPIRSKSTAKVIFVAMGIFMKFVIGFIVLSSLSQKKIQNASPDKLRNIVK